MMRKSAKVGIIILLIIPLIIIGNWGMGNIKQDSTYSLKELVTKYPTIIDLKHGVDSGELDYDKLPTEAKTALNEFKENKGQKIIGGLK